MKCKGGGCLWLYVGVMVDASRLTQNTLDTTRTCAYLSWWNGTGDESEPINSVEKTHTLISYHCHIMRKFLEVDTIVIWTD